jgi:hypothetical protein
VPAHEVDALRTIKERQKAYSRDADMDKRNMDGYGEVKVGTYTYEIRLWP